MFNAVRPYRTLIALITVVVTEGSLLVAQVPDPFGTTSLSSGTQQDWESFGPPGGTAREFATDTSRGIIYAASMYDLYRSTNDGASWDLLPLSTGWLDTNAGLGAGRIYVKEGVAYATSAPGPIHKSTDGGDTWTSLTEMRTVPQYPQITNSIAVLHDTIFITNNGSYEQGPYYYSGDGGLTWVSDSTHFNTWRVVSGENTVYAFGQDGIFARNGHGDWSEISPDTYAVVYPVTWGNRIFLPFNNSLMRAYEGAYEWETIENYPEDPSNVLPIINNDTLYWVDQHGTVYGMHVDDNELTVKNHLPLGYEGRLAATDDRLFISAAGFRYRASLTTGKWDSAESGWRSHMIRYLKYLDWTLFAGTQDGVYAYYGGEFGWQRLLPLQSYEVVTSIDTAHGRLFVNTARAPFIHYSEDGGMTWHSDVLPDLGFVYASLSIIDGVYYVCAGPDGLYRSTDHGTTWEKMPDVPSLSVNRIAPRVTGSGSNIFVTAENLMLYSPDRGTTWTQLEPDSIPSGSFELGVDNGRLYLMPIDGDAFRTLYPDDPSLLGGTMYYSDDYGATWHGTGHTLPYGKLAGTERSVPRFQRLFVHGDTVLVTLYDTAYVQLLYASTDRGMTWNEVPTNPYWKPEIVEMQGGTLYAGTTGRGVLRTPFRTILSAPDETTQSETALPSIGLLYNSRNRTAEFALQTSEVIRLALYSIDGRLISLLRTGHLEAGRYQTPLPLDTTPKGAYVLVLETESEQITRPVVVY